jgi:hypothetical protein
MRAYSLKLLIVLAVGLTGLAGVTPASQARGVNILGVGPMPVTYADAAIAQAKRLHAGVVRTEVPWSAVEPVSASVISQPTLAFMDRLIADASADGISVILNVDSSPCWASAAPSSLIRKCRPNAPSAANGYPPKNPADFAAFVRYLAERYGRQAGAIEVWNEPDQSNQLYFAGPHKATRYAAILRAAYPAIKEASPQTTVLGGSIVGANGLFLRALYAAGIKGYYDALAVHFYTLTIASLRAIHEVQLANGDHTQLWLDEFGWSSCWPRHKIEQQQACVTPAVQAQNITSVFGQLSHTDYVAAGVIYKMQSDSLEDFGMLSAGGRPKPAFAALVSAMSSPLQTPIEPSLSLRRSGSSILANGTGPVGDFMVLEALVGGAPRYRSYFVLDRFNRYSIPLPSVLGTSGLSVRVFQYGGGPARAATRSL